MLLLFMLLEPYVSAGLVDDIAQDIVRNAVKQSIYDAKDHAIENFNSTLRTYADPIVDQMEHLRSFTRLSWNDVWYAVKNLSPYKITANPDYVGQRANASHLPIPSSSSSTTFSSAPSGTTSPSTDGAHSPHEPKSLLNDHSPTNRAASKSSKTEAAHEPRIYDLWFR
ncbi:hypothetical protein VCUG_02138 [Vavraia culicis subsp. floridensis]|uniref:Uncharacterized protein n=1 Tax=Vavraia culicis (isolate floridensis) TaxID=948595 RepID=L2GRY6_VAVCU|nr:uncharacterized protein VCUG_02138 [Vavraia culicis subsp. floridensis]ELA46374.1 hypothetical protein VCUG_02138 [Vavraia culicis subsp. floridensis]